MHCEGPHREGMYREETYPGLISLPGGEYFVGTDAPVIAADGEGPRRRVELSAFSLAATSVTNARFSEFANDTGYISYAEHLGYSMVFRTQLAEDARTRGAPVGTPWWLMVEGANWKNPGGARSAEPAPADHPVVHVCWHDAVAYCQWAGGRLPNEAEWEAAARSDQGDVRYPWGNQDPPTESNRLCNIWHGAFPDYTGPTPKPVPVNTYEPNASGFYNLCGNVWEWTADHFSNAQTHRTTRRIMKGGSFLCHKSYCFRYRIAARIGVSPESSTSHQGFRIAFGKNL
ncbi:MAG: formylglycine-generating enzyme family protein [Granulosicoccus sp.]|nr:formylglycine-generating enzyme family protein [Granulosicoccus sp.]